MCYGQERTTCHHNIQPLRETVGRGKVHMSLLVQLPYAEVAKSENARRVSRLSYYQQDQALSYIDSRCSLLVRVQPSAPYRDLAQFGRAPGLGPGGRRFNSCNLDHRRPLFGRLLLCMAVRSLYTV